MLHKNTLSETYIKYKTGSYDSAVTNVGTRFVYSRSIYTTTDTEQFVQGLALSEKYPANCEAG